MCRSRCPIKSSHSLRQHTAYKFVASKQLGQRCAAQDVPSNPRTRCGNTQHTNSSHPNNWASDVPLKMSHQILALVAATHSIQIRRIQTIGPAMCRSRCPIKSSHSLRQHTAYKFVASKQLG